jgi:ATP/maltotriose-dependent transcriptional regulator MalT
LGTCRFGYVAGLGLPGNRGGVKDHELRPLSLRRVFRLAHDLAAASGTLLVDRLGDELRADVRVRRVAAETLTLGERHRQRLAVRGVITQRLPRRANGVHGVQSLSAEGRALTAERVEPFAADERLLLHLMHLAAGPRLDGVTPPVQPVLRSTLELLLLGLSEKAIAEQTATSRHTVHGRVRRLYQHFGVCNRVELVKAAGRTGI